MIGKTMVTDHASTIKAIDATTPAETLTLTMASPTFKVRACVNAGLSACMHMHMHTCTRTAHTALHANYACDT